MSTRIINVIFGLFGMIASSSTIIAVILAPFALYKGLKLKNWKLGKIVAIMFVGGFIFLIIILGIWSKISGATG